MRDLLEKLYVDLPDGGRGDSGECAVVDELLGAGASVYGEITTASAARLLRWMKPGRDDVFLDCGSGRGRLVLQTHLETEAGLALGVEVAGFRHRIAVEALRRLDAEMGRSPSGQGRVEFHHGDFRDLDLHHLTLVYAGSLCFPDTLMEALGELCLAAPRFRLLCTLKPLPPSLARQFSVRGHWKLEMSWQAETRVHVFGPRPRGRLFSFNLESQIGDRGK